MSVSMYKLQGSPFLGQVLDHHSKCGHKVICTPRVASRVHAQQGGRILREVLSPQQRTKLNKSDDRGWYSTPRIVQHSDDIFRRQVTQLYKQRIPDEAVVLDLCSSWVSHLPTDKSYARVVGHGLNAQELARNPQLTEFFVRNLNEDPNNWVFDDCTFDAVLCCCSIQYIQQPEQVLSEILRVLKPGGICIITFTNRMFYEKAIAAWRDSSDYAHRQLVKQYFYAIEGWKEPEEVTAVDGSQPQGLVESARAFLQQLSGGAGDPFNAVIAYKA